RPSTPTPETHAPAPEAAVLAGGVAAVPDARHRPDPAGPRPRARPRLARLGLAHPVAAPQAPLPDPGRQRAHRGNAVRAPETRRHAGSEGPRFRLQQQPARS